MGRKIIGAPRGGIAKSIKRRGLRQEVVMSGADYISHETLPVSTLPVALTPPEGCDWVFLTVETAPVRFWFDGDPTNAAGHLLQIGDVLTLDSPTQVVTIRFIAKSADSTLQVSYGDWGGE